MIKHTPGPWIAHHGWEFGGPTEEHPDWCEITGGSHKDNTHISITGHIGIANARLIAAAPEMYEALKALVDAGWRTQEDDKDTPQQFEKARHALAKAEGRS